VNIPLMDKRVRSLEEMMADLIATVAQTSVEMRGFKDGIEDFKEEMRQFKDETRREHRNLNKQLGEIANKQGRMAEDLVAPSVCRILQEVVNCPPNLGCGFLVRPRRVHPKDRSRVKEFDVIAECGDYVLVNETKSNLSPADINKLRHTIEEVREYFPEYAERKMIGSLATLYVDESLVKRASRKGIIVLAVGDELMDVMNEPGFRPAEF
jgi:hypothetical protein